MKELVSNRKAFHHYDILETYEAGIALVGTEVKSLREQQGNLQDAYILISDSKVILKNASISPYKQGNIYNHEEKRDRILLLHHHEIAKLRKASDEKGLTLIPLSIYLKSGFIKVKVGVAKGKKLHDKRAAVKAKEDRRAMERALKDARQ